MNNDQVTVTLTRQQFDYIVQVLSQRPWGEANPVIIALLQMDRDQRPDKVREIKPT